MPYEVIEGRHVPIKAWTRGVEFEDEARKQLENLASLPFVFRHIAAMPDVHFGLGATVGSVVATKGAIIPAAVGVDIGCGMIAAHTSLAARDLPDDLHPLRCAIETAVPHGRTHRGGPNDRGAWGTPPPEARDALGRLDLGTRFERIKAKHPHVSHAMLVNQLGTLGTGNHFIEICLDESEGVWIMLHSGSRGVGNKIGTYFIELAKKDMQRLCVNLPDKDLAYLSEGTVHFDDYVEAVAWAQDYAMTNRGLMLLAVRGAMEKTLDRPIALESQVVNCHHNYVQLERHFDEDVLVTRKGAVSAKAGELGIIPGSMGARSYIVRGKGNPQSFESCSHGAGRRMSRSEAKRRFSVEDHATAVEGIECRVDPQVIDETPGAYKSIDAVMAAQSDLVEVEHTLRQVICVKG